MAEAAGEKIIAYCGLVCDDCGAFKKGKCQGCHCDKPLNRGCKVKPLLRIAGIARVPSAATLTTSGIAKT